ncbi:MAG TPA: hypothetical protein VN961_20640 [Streptosporangiaceae bacterium]|nr:hypothetical protein [Streptosporangiaceae bacterium]
MTRVTPNVPLTIASSSEMTTVSAIRASRRRGSACPVAAARLIGAEVGAPARLMSSSL